MSKMPPLHFSFSFCCPFTVFTKLLNSKIAKPYYASFSFWLVIVIKIPLCLLFAIFITDYFTFNVRYFLSMIRISHVVYPLLQHNKEMSASAEQQIICEANMYLKTNICKRAREKLSVPYDHILFI
jgi:hypothetical protein